MTRRPYTMGRRTEAVQQTRRRILDAAMAVHDEQGIAAGRWPDIAERAGVSLATLYRHFPTLDELATACGELTMELVDPPSIERATALFGTPAPRVERIERLVEEVFGFYERAGRMVDNAA
ncbi:MAG: TetR/AcrR family transcriptional regulator [Solirubrobacteraceae bacterium]